MLILIGTITIVIGCCMVAAGIYEGAKKKEPKEDVLEDLESVE